MTKREKTIEWTKEVLSGIGELLMFMLDPRAQLNVSAISKMGYGQWRDREAFYQAIRERNKILKARKDSAEKIYKVLWKLEQQKIIQTKKDGKRFSLSLTFKGFLKMLRFSLFKTKPMKWDGKWRIVVFDIPEKYKSTRESLRKYLYAMGFAQIQKSVFITKRECLNEVRALMRSCEMEPFTEYFVAEKWKPTPVDPLS